MLQWKNLIPLPDYNPGQFFKIRLNKNIQLFYFLQSEPKKYKSQFIYPEASDFEK